MKKKQDKLHLLRGLKKILLDIDRAIKIIRETEEDDQVVPNLMIGFGIDDVQAEYVAEIKLRNINEEYILKRIEEVAGLEEEIADLQDIVNNPGRIKKLIVAELQAVQKKYAVPGGRRSSTSTRPPPRRTRMTRPRTTRCTCSAPGRATSRRSPPSPCA